MIQGSPTYLLWQNLTAAELRAAADKATVIVPIAATEQHGPHLVSGTDTIIADAVLEQVRQHPPTTGLFVQLPTQAIGASDHHVEFGGTVSLPSLLYTEILVAQIRCLLRQNFRRILVFNSHGGNIAPMKTAMAELAVEAHAVKAIVGGLSYWELARTAWDDIVELRGRVLTHACEFETSMIYAARPDLPRTPPPPRHDLQDTVDSRCALALPFSATTGTGAYGNPAAASSELGRRLIDLAAQELRAFLSDFATYSPNAVTKSTDERS